MKVFSESQTSVTARGYSIREICQNLGLSKGFLLLEIKRGKLSVRRLGRRVIVLDEDLRLYLDQARSDAASATRPSGCERRLYGNEALDPQ